VSKLVAIHQPNFFPWLGYFDKLARSDVFVILDHVQFSKTKGNWGNRVQLLLNRQPRWVTMPVRRDFHGVRRFNEMLASPQLPWRDDLIKTLRTNYGRAPRFAEVFSVIEPLVLNPIDNLGDYNVSAIKTLARNLKVDPDKIVLSSQFAVESQATQMLIDLVGAVGGDGYLNGGGASGYLEPEKFAGAGIELVQQNFQHPVYPQVGGVGFAPGLSCLDAVFNCGFEAVGSWLKGTGKQMDNSAA
jgi:WbqC-like protein family